MAGCFMLKDLKTKQTKQTYTSQSLLSNLPNPDLNERSPTQSLWVTDLQIVQEADHVKQILWWICSPRDSGPETDDHPAEPELIQSENPFRRSRCHIWWMEVREFCRYCGTVGEWIPLPCWLHSRNLRVYCFSESNHTDVQMKCNMIW